MTSVSVQEKKKDHLERRTVVGIIPLLDLLQLVVLVTKERLRR